MLIRRPVLAAGLFLTMQLAAPAPLMARTLRVGISGSPPFVIRNADGFSGLSVEIWRKVAEDNDIPYKLIAQPSPNDGIAAVGNWDVDVLVGPISITAKRLAIPEVDFTQPYYLGKEGVLLPLHPPSLLSRLRVFFGWTVISSHLLLLFVLLVVGALVWLAERNSNPEQFPKKVLGVCGQRHVVCPRDADHSGVWRQGPDHAAGAKHRCPLDDHLPDRGLLAHCWIGLSIHPVSVWTNRRRDHRARSTSRQAGCGSRWIQRHGIGRTTTNAGGGL